MNIDFNQLTEQQKLDLYKDSYTLLESETMRADKAELLYARLLEMILEIIIFLAGFNVALWIGNQ